MRPGVRCGSGICRCQWYNLPTQKPPTVVPVSLPLVLIELEPMHKIDYRDPAAPTQLTVALRHTGFAVLTQPPIPATLIAAVYQEWQGFFAAEDKYRYTFDSVSQSGYFPFQTEQAKGYSQPDLKEFFHLYPHRTQLPLGISQRSLELCDRLTQLATELLGWLEAALPKEIRQQLPLPLEEMITGSQETLLRPIHYPPLSGEEAAGAIRAAAHEDVNLLTLLPAATATGLEVQDNQGNWQPIPSDLGDLVVNVGDMLALVSNDYYRSTSHRVVNPEGEAAYGPRFSMPLFLHPRSEVHLTATITAKEFLQQRLREIGLL
jgi:isopenicillin N synthase-like dioxygenase